MLIPAWIAAQTATLLAFANGANDNAKGVASLIGSGRIGLRAGLLFAAFATFLGSAASAVLATELTQRFTGAGIVDPGVAEAPSFALGVGLAAGLTVLAATRLALPVSTTHALVGAIAGIGLGAGGLDGGAVLERFLGPLLVSPLVAIALTSLVYLFFRRMRRATGVSHRTCICIGREMHPVSVHADGSLVLAATGMTLTADEIESCRERYDGHVLGISAQRGLDVAHVLSAGVLSFARGLNDTAKISAVLIATAGLTHGISAVTCGIAIAAGGLFAGRRLARTVSFGITEMNDGQAFSANIVSALLVLFASKLGMPVSTTHVTCGSLFGIGILNGTARWRLIGGILLAWTSTLPLAAALGFGFTRLVGF